MSLFIFIGWQRHENKSVHAKCVYAGEDGAAGEREWNKAIREGSFIRGVRYSNPSNGSPLPIDPKPTKATVPTFHSKSRAAVVPKIALPEKSIQDAEEKIVAERSLIEKQRLARLAMTGDNPDATKIVGSPTIEQYVKAGYPAEAYPPAGCVEVDSQGLRAYREQIAAAASPLSQSVELVTSAGTAPAEAPKATEVQSPEVKAQAPVPPAAKGAPSAPPARRNRRG